MSSRRSGNYEVENDTLPEGWQVKKLGEVAQVGAGNSAPQDKALFDGGMHPFIRTSDVGKIRFGKITVSEDWLNDKGIKGLNIVKRNTLLMPKSGASTYLNHRVLLDTDGYVSNHLATIAANTKVLSPRYLLYAMSLVRAQDLLQVQTYPSLNLSTIKSIEIPLPPLSEQKTIVSLLDKVFTAIDKAKENLEKNIQNARELFQSELNTIFTEGQTNPQWQMKKLGEVCKTRTGGTPLRSNKEYYEGGKIPWLLSGEVGQGEITNASNFITDKGINNSSAKLFPPNSVLIALYGATAGEVGILRFEAATNQAICAIFPNEKIIPEYLFYYFQNKKDELVAQATGNTQPNLSQLKIRNTTIPLLPLSEQKAIVATLDQLSEQTKSLELAYRQKHVNIEEMKKSFLQQAFKGQLL